MSPYEKAYDTLEKEKLVVYPPATKYGECKKPYVVLKDNGKSKANTYSSQFALLDMMCYVPQARYTDLEFYVNKCKKAMKKVYPMFIPTGLETPSFYDDSVKAWMISVEYRNSQRAKNIV